MNIHQFEQIDGTVARMIRHDLGRSQEVFWGEVGIRRETGSNYEKSGRVPEPVQRLLFMRYVAGIPLGSEPDLMNLGRLAGATAGAIANIRFAAECVRNASHQLDAALSAVAEQSKEKQ